LVFKQFERLRTLAGLVALDQRTVTDYFFLPLSPEASDTAVPADFTSLPTPFTVWQPVRANPAATTAKATMFFMLRSFDLVFKTHGTGTAGTGYGSYRVFGFDLNLIETDFRWRRSSEFDNRVCDRNSGPVGKTVGIVTHV